MSLRRRELFRPSEPPKQQRLKQWRLSRRLPRLPVVAWAAMPEGSFGEPPDSVGQSIVDQHFTIDFDLHSGVDFLGEGIAEALQQIILTIGGLQRLRHERHHRKWIASVLAKGLRDLHGALQVLAVQDALRLRRVNV